MPSLDVVGEEPVGRGRQPRSKDEDRFPEWGGVRIYTDTRPGRKYPVYRVCFHYQGKTYKKTCKMFSGPEAASAWSKGSVNCPGAWSQTASAAAAQAAAACDAIRSWAA